jgi:murein DD-endopeptidase MepM/ murein hydrolase activator NlpD
MAMLEGLAEMGVDAALNYATGGGYQAIPKPLRDMLNKIVVKESLKKIRTILKALKIAAAAAMAVLAALVKLAHTAITAGGALGGALVGGGVGFVIGGPIGGLIGTALGGLAGLFGGKGAANRVLSTTAADSARAGARNVSAAAEGLGDAAKQQASLTGTGAEAAALESTVGANVAAQVAGYAVAGMGAMAATTLLVMTAFQSAFLIDPPLSPQELDRMGISQYVNIKKEARIINEDSGCAGTRRCENPNFPVLVQYTITIEPKNNYILEIIFIEDDAKTLYNKDAYSSLADVPSTPPHNEIYLSSDDDPIILNPVDDDPSNDRHTIVYEKEYGSDYNHALIRNAATTKFIYSKDGSQGTDEARSSTSVALGEAPQELLCWPNDGYITSVPFRGIKSHITTDAYDIATGRKVVPAYAPADGRLCGGGFGNNPSVGYGYHVTLSTSILGEDYLFVLGHLDEPSFLVPINGDCVEVNRGDRIGNVGNTGNSDGHHMHLEKRRESGSLSLTELLTGDTAILNYGQTIYSCASEQ